MSRVRVPHLPACFRRLATPHSKLVQSARLLWPYAQLSHLSRQASRRAPLLLGVCLFAGAAAAQTTVSLSTSPTSTTTGQVVTLTANVSVGGSPATVGQVHFFQQLGSGYSELGVIQVVRNPLFGHAVGSATFKTRLASGTHQIFADYIANGNVKTGVLSSTQTVTVKNPSPSTVVTSSGTAGNYTLTTTITAPSITTPTGTVTFTDQSKNSGLGTANLGSGTSSGTGHAAVTKATISQIYNESSMAYGDFNNDGIPDIVVAGADTNNPAGGRAVVYYGNGDGTFTVDPSGAVYSTDWAASKVVVGDFDGDGQLDFAIAENRAPDTQVYGSTVYVYAQNASSNGYPTFGKVAAKLTGSSTTDMTWADVNGDGIPDLVVANSGNSIIGVLFGQTGYSYFSNVAQTGVRNAANTAGAAVFNVAVGDFTGDGKADIAVTDSTANCVYIMAGDGNGNFSQQSYMGQYGAYAVGTTPSQMISYAAYGGNANLAVLAKGSDTLSILRGTGSGLSGGSTYGFVSTGSGANLAGLALGDINQDGNIDAVATDVANGNAYILMGTSGGGFSGATTITGGGRDVPVTIVDEDGDGFPDILTATSLATGSVNTSLTQQTISASASVSSIPLYGGGTANHTVVSSYGGDANYGATTSNTLSLAGSYIPTSISLNSTQTGNVVPTSSLTLTATFSPTSAAGYTATGTLTFYDNGSVVCAAVNVPSNGVVSCTIPSVTAGSHSYTTGYSGDTNFGSSTSNTIGITANKVATTVTMSANPSQNLRPTDITTLTVTVSPSTQGSYQAGGTVTIYYNGTNTTVCTVPLAANGVETCQTPAVTRSGQSYQAIYSGDAVFAYGYTLNATTVQAVAYTTGVTLSANPSTAVAAGATTTLTAQLTTPTTNGTAATGSISFTDGTNAICSNVAFDATGKANCTTTALYNGAHSFSSTYSGDSNYTPATSNTVSLTVANAATYSTATTLTVPSATVTTGSAGVLTATVVGNGAPVTAGTVNFCIAGASTCMGKNLIGSATLVSSPGASQGTATLRTTLPVGTYSIKAVFVGTTGVTTVYTASTSSAASVVFGNAPTSTSLSSSGSAGSYVLTANVASATSALPTGTIQINDLTEGNGTLLSQGITTSLGTSGGLGAFHTLNLFNTPYVFDVNNDGRPDLIAPSCGSYNDGTFSVSLNLGGGNFAAPVCYGGGGTLAIADFNGDGNLDIVANNSTLWLGNGDGTFTQQSGTISAGGTIFAADLNHDGLADLGYFSGGTLYVMAGNGDGTFQPAVSQPIGVGPSNGVPIVADFNGDGLVDLAFISGGNLWVVLANPAAPAIFKAPASYSAANAVSVETADLNNDGIADLVVFSSNPQITAFVGNGDGTFTAKTAVALPKNDPANYAYGYAPRFALLDLNGDGNVDFVTGAYGDIPNAYSGMAFYYGYLVKSYGDGTGNFGSPSMQQTHGPDGGVANDTDTFIPFEPADFDGDGHLDFGGLAPTTTASQGGTDGNKGIYLTSFTSGTTTTFSGVSVPGTGTNSLDAVFTGAPLFASSTSGTVSLTGSGSRTSTTLTLTSNAPYRTPAGFSLTLTATLSPLKIGQSVYPTGSIVFMEGATVIGTVALANGSASTTITSITAGPHTYTATYAGDTDFAGSTSSAYSVSVVPLTTTTLGVSPAPPQAPGTLQTFTATVVSGSTPVTQGIVLFCDATMASCNGPGQLGSASLASAGTATLSLRLGGGDHSIKAVFQATSAYYGSSSAAQSVITTAAPTVTLTSAGNPGSYTLNAALSTTADASLQGTVSFFDTTNNNFLLGTAPVTAATATASFAAATGSPITTASRPFYVAVGDVNHDGIPDLVVANAGGGSVTVWLGDGTGSFTAHATLTVGTSPHAIVLGDFNHDGNTDIAVACDTAGAIYTFTGDGTGSFTAKATITAGTPSALVVGDFNGDGLLDLAATNTTAGTVSIFLGDGTGNFTLTGSAITVGSHPYSIGRGDFNADGIPDLAVVNSNSNSVTILLGNGNGAFTQASGSPITVAATNVQPTYVTVGDLNGDGIADLVVTNFLGNNVAVLKGNGTGGFTAFPGSPFSVGTSPATTVLADINGDGNVDLVTSNTGSNNETVLLGDGTGNFTAASYSPLTIGSQPYFGAVADFNGDGLPDIVAANTNASTLSVLLNGGTAMAGATLPSVLIPGGGTHQIDAVYGGDTHYSAATSPAIGLTASPYTTTTTLSVSPTATADFGQTVTLTAVVAPITGAGYTNTGVVTFQSGGTPIACNVSQTTANGTTVCVTTQLPVGTQSLTAVNAGDTNFNGSTSAAVSYTVIAQTATQLAITTGPLTPLFTGENAGTVTAAVRDASGNVVYANSDTITLTVTGPSSYSQTYTQTAQQGVASFNLASVYLSAAGTYTYTVTDGSLSSASATGVVYARGVFGSVAVGSSSTQLVNVRFGTAGTLGSISVVLQGVSSPEYTRAAGANTGTCTVGTAYTAGQVCTVGVTFTPAKPGARSGAVLLSTSGSTPAVLATSYLSGTGVQAAVGFPPAVNTLSFPSNFDGSKGFVSDLAGDLYYFLPHTTGSTYDLTKRLPAGTTSIAATGFGAPTSIAVDGAGNLYVTDASNTASTGLYKIAAGSSTAQQVATGLSGSYPSFVTVDPTGTPFVIAQLNVVRLPVDGTGSFTVNFNNYSYNSTPTLLTTDNNGNIDAVVKNSYNGGNYLYTVNAVTGAISQVTGQGFNTVAGVVVDPSGDTWVAENTNVFFSTGALTKLRINNYGGDFPVQTGMNKPVAMTGDGNGNLYVANAGTGSGTGVVQLSRNPPATLVLPTANVGSNSYNRVVLENYGTAPLTFTSSASANYTESDSCGTLAIGQPCSYVTVYFQPTSGLVSPGKAITGTLTLSGTAPTLSLPLTGQAIASPTKVGFATAPASQVANGSNAGTVVASVQYADGTAYPQGTGTVTLTVTGPNSYSKTYTQALNSSGLADFTSQLASVYPPASISPYTYTVSLSGYASSSATQTVLPVGFFPATTIGTQSAAQPVTVTFTNPTYMNISNIQVLTNGVANVDFTQQPSTGTCFYTQSSYYHAGDTCTIYVYFKPTGIGQRNGAVIISGYTNVNVLTPMGVAYIGGTGAAGQGTLTTATQTGVTATLFGAGLSFPYASTLDGANTLYIADTINLRILKVPSGCTTASCATVLPYSPPTTVSPSYLHGLALDGAGNLFAVDTNNKAVTEIPAGCTTKACIISLGTGLSSPFYGSVDSQGNFYVVDIPNKPTVARVVEIPAGCTNSSCWITAVTGLNYPQGLAVDGSGAVYVSDQSAITKYPAGCSTTSCKVVISSYAFASNLAVDGNGNVYYVSASSNTSANNIVEYPAGCTNYACSITLPVGGGLSYPESILVDGSGNFIISDAGNNRIAKVDRSQTALTFNNAVVNTATAAQDVTLTNAGNQSLALSALAAPTYFSFSGADTTCTATTTLAPNASCVLGVKFVAPATGSQTGNATATDNTLAVAGTKQIIALTGNAPDVATQLIYGTAPPATLSSGGNAGTVTVQEEDANNVVVTTSTDTITLLVTGPGNYSQTYTQAASSGVASFSLSGATLSAVGSYTYTASFSSLTPATAQESVSKASTSISLAPPTPSTGVVYGQTVSLTATLNPPSLTGTITFNDNGNAICTGVAFDNNGNATCTTPALTVGTHSFTAVYSGDTNDLGSTSNAQSLSVGQQTQTITFTAPASPVTFGVPPITLTATGGASTSPVVFSVVSGPGTISGSTLTVTGAGTIVVAANQAADTNYSAAPQVTQSVVVNQATTTLALAAPSPNTGVLYNQTVSLTATLSTGSATGTITFSDNGTAICSSVSFNSSGVASCTTPALATGSHSFTAAYPGDTNYAGSTSAAQSLNVGQQTQTITFTAPASPVTYGVAPITLVATGGASGNAVTFSVLSGPGTISGSTLTITGAGTVVVAADQAGNTNYAAATEVTQTVIVNKASTSVALAAPNPNTGVMYGQTVNLTATVSVPTATGSITFTDNGNTICSAISFNSSGVATCTSPALAAGPHSLAAMYSGDSNYLSSTSGAQPLVVGQGAQAISFTPISSPVTYGVSPITLSATGGASGNAVVFSVVSGPATISGSTLTITGVGTVVVAANQAGNPNYAAAPQVTQTVVVNQAASSITLAAPVPNSGVIAGQMVSLTATVNVATPAGTVTFSDNGNAICSNVALNSGESASCITPALLDGAHSFTAAYSGSTNYFGSLSNAQALSVSGIAQSITFTAPPTPVTYGVAAVTLTASGGASGNPVVFSVLSGPGSISGSTLTFNGAGTVVVAADQAGNSTYAAATEVTRTVIVNQAAPSLSWTPAVSSVYVGNALGTGVLDAASMTPGTVSYTAALQPSGSPVAVTSATVLAPGAYTLTATLAPTDSADYSSASATRTFTVAAQYIWAVNGDGTLSELNDAGGAVSPATGFSGGGPASFAIALDHSGNVWSVNAAAGTVVEYSKTGASVSTGTGFSGGGLATPQALAIDGSGLVWVANGNGSVSVLRNDGTAITPSTGYKGGNMGASTGIAIDSSGSVWVANGNNSVTEILGGASPVITPNVTAVQNNSLGVKP